MQHSIPNTVGLGSAWVDGLISKAQAQGARHNPELSLAQQHPHIIWKTFTCALLCYTLHPDWCCCHGRTCGMSVPTAHRAGEDFSIKLKFIYLFFW